MANSFDNPSDERVDVSAKIRLIVIGMRGFGMKLHLPLIWVLKEMLMSELATVVVIDTESHRNHVVNRSKINGNSLLISITDTHSKVNILVFIEIIIENFDGLKASNSFLTY